MKLCFADQILLTGVGKIHETLKNLCKLEVQEKEL
jgi:hypothetical protein